MNKHEPDKLHVEADEKDLLIDHSYDGIQELNHPLPSWWNVVFYISIIFAGAYFFYYQFLGGPTLKEEFKKDYENVMIVQDEFKRANGVFNQEQYNAILVDDGVNKGAVVFEANCMPCHAEKGRGETGPNLTDEYWLLAKGTPETIYSVIFNGSEENGMPAWSELITKEEIYHAVAYVMSLKNTNQKGGKAPQGEKID